MIPYTLEHIDRKGVKWHPYTVDFESPDGKFAVHIYAISEEHANLQLQALKDTGRVAYRVLGVVE